MSPDPDAQAVCAVFNQTFTDGYDVSMVGGGKEPLYEPARQGQRARIVFTRDYAASALHEAAHWCVAGRVRRAQPDYGYGYLQPPRTEAQMEAFMTQETRVQALELLFSEAAGMTFRVSIDDLEAPLSLVEIFDTRVRTAAAELDRIGVEGRGARFRQALRGHFAPLLRGGTWAGTQGGGSSGG